MKRTGPALAWALCSLLAACADEEGPPRPLPQSHLGSAVPAAASTPTPVTTAQPAPAARPARRPRWPHEQPTPAAPVPPPPEADTPEEAEKPPRDLPAELLQQLGGAPACLKPRARSEASSSYRIALTAVVGPTGRVTRSEATSRQLHTEELLCIRDQVERVRFATPIDGAPTSVRATLELQLAPSNGTP